MELKNTMTELNNLIESFKSQLDQARRKKNGELKDRPIEMINQRSRKKTTKRNEESLWDSWDNIKRNKESIAEVPEGKEEKGRKLI